MIVFIWWMFVKCIRRSARGTDSRINKRYLNYIGVKSEIPIQQPTNLILVVGVIKWSIFETTNFVLSYRDRWLVSVGVVHLPINMAINIEHDNQVFRDAAKLKVIAISTNMRWCLDIYMRLW